MSMTEPSRCPEAEERAAQSDAEFYERVARNLGAISDFFDPDAGPKDESLFRDPCYVCGSIGACGWDAEGRPLIHAVDDEEED